MTNPHWVYYIALCRVLGLCSFHMNLKIEHWALWKKTKTKKTFRVCLQQHKINDHCNSYRDIYSNMLSVCISYCMLGEIIFASTLFFRAKYPSCLFFQYNTQLGPPYYILVDTNFINFSIKAKLDVVQSMMDCLYAKCKSPHSFLRIIYNNANVKWVNVFWMCWWL